MTDYKFQRRTLRAFGFGETPHVFCHADNFDTNPGTGGTRFASDDLGGSPAVHVTRVKAGHGADGSYSDPSLAAPFPTYAMQESNQATVAGVPVTIKYAIIDAAGSGDNTLLAAVTSKKIRVLSAFLIAAGTVNVRFESGASGTALTGQMNLVANTGFVLPYNPGGWFETASNTLLNLELSGAVSVDGSFSYIEV